MKRRAWYSYTVEAMAVRSKRNKDFFSIRVTLKRLSSTWNQSSEPLQNFQLTTFDFCNIWQLSCDTRNPVIQSASWRKKFRHGRKGPSKWEWWRSTSQIFPFDSVPPWRNSISKWRIRRKSFGTLQKVVFEKSKHRIHGLAKRFLES